MSISPAESAQSSAGLPTAQIKRDGFFTHVGKSLLGRLLFGLASTMIVGLLSNFIQIKAVVFFICAAIASWGGYKTEPPKDVEDRKATIISKVKEVVAPVKEVVKDSQDPDKPTIKERIAEKVAEPVKQAVVAPVKEAVHEVGEGAQKVGEKVTDTAEKVGEKLAGGGAAVKKKFAATKAAAQEKMAANAAEHERLSKIWYEKGPNGMCVGCMKPMRVPQRGTGRYGCVKCGTNSSAAAIRSMGRPPMPYGFRGF